MPDTFASPFEDEEDDYDVLIEMNGYGAQELPPPSAQSASYNSQAARDYGPSMAGSFEQSRFIRGTRAAVLAAADNASRSRSQSLAATNRRQQLAGWPLRCPIFLNPDMALRVVLSGTSRQLVCAYPLVQR